MEDLTLLKCQRATSWSVYSQWDEFHGFHRMHSKGCSLVKLKSAQHSFRISSTSSGVVLGCNIRICCTWIVLDPISRFSQYHTLKFISTSQNLSGLSSSPLTPFLKLDYDVISFLLFWWRHSVPFLCRCCWMQFLLLLVLLVVNDPL